MAQDNKNNNKKSQFQQPSPRTTIISVVLFLIVAFFVGQQFMNMSSTTQTDGLITSEFVQAVEQDRVTKVVYDAGGHTVSGSYYPAVTAGSTAANAFNDAFQALNARMATLKNPDTGKALGGDLDGGGVFVEGVEVAALQTGGDLPRVAGTAGSTVEIGAAGADAERLDTLCLLYTSGPACRTAPGCAAHRAPA